MDHIIIGLSFVLVGIFIFALLINYIFVEHIETNIEEYKAQINNKEKIKFIVWTFFKIMGKELLNPTSLGISFILGLLFISVLVILGGVVFTLFTTSELLRYFHKI
jgi:uncharacterized membrane protein SpoIIM required for sporulation